MSIFDILCDGVETTFRKGLGRCAVVDQLRILVAHFDAPGKRRRPVASYSDSDSGKPVVVTPNAPLLMAGSPSASYLGYGLGEYK